MKKLEQQELKQLQELQIKSQNILLELGQISFNEIILNQRKDDAKKLLNEIQSEEKTFKEYIISKYGDIDINLETGEF